VVNPRTKSTIVGSGRFFVQGHYFASTINNDPPKPTPIQTLIQGSLEKTGPIRSHPSFTPTISAKN